MIKLTKQEAAGIHETLFECFRIAQQVEDWELVVDIDRAIHLVAPKVKDKE